MSKWIVILTNNSGSSIEIADLGFTLAIAETRTISNTFKFDEISTSQNLKTEISNGNIGVNNGTDDLSAADGVYYVFLENRYHVDDIYAKKTDFTIHGSMAGREEPNQHPITAITSLSATLSGLATYDYVNAGLQIHVDEYHALSAIHTADVVALSASIDSVNDSLTVHIEDTSNPHAVSASQVYSTNGYVQLDIDNLWNDKAELTHTDANDAFLSGAIDLRSTIVYTDIQDSALSAAIDLKTDITYTQAHDTFLSGAIDGLTSDTVFLSASIDTNTTGVSDNATDVVALSAAIDGLTSSDILEYWTEGYSADGTSWTPVNSDVGTAIGDSTNAARAPYSAVCGGYKNVVAVTTGNNSTIAGGYENEIAGGDGSIGGGRWNKISSDSPYATIGGGGGANSDNGNEILNASNYGTIAGGTDNILSGGYASFIGGGDSNEIKEFGGESAIVGGSSNHIWGANNNFIGGGTNNKIFATLLTGSGAYSTIAGGTSNEIDSEYSAILGGRYGRTLTTGQQAHASGRFTVTGDAQASSYVLRQTLTSSTKDWLSPVGTTGGIVISNNQTMSFIGTVTARTSGDNAISSDTVASWKIEGVVSANSSGTITVHDYTVTVIYNPTTAWIIDASSEAINTWSIGFTATGWSENIRVVADIQTSEVIFA